MLMPYPVGPVHNVDMRNTHHQKKTKLDGAVAALLDQRSPQDLCKLQLNDATMRPVLRAVEENTRLEPDAISRGGPEVR